MTFPNLAGLAGVPLADRGLEALIAAYMMRANELVQAAAIYTQVVDDLKRLATHSSDSLPEIAATPAATPRPSVARQASIAAVLAEPARLDATVGDGYDPNADARSVAAMLLAKGGKQ